MNIYIDKFNSKLESIYSLFPERTAMSVAISKDEKIIYSNCKGTAVCGTAVDLNTRFNIGSVSKMFLTVSVLILCENNSISIDDQLYKYIDDFEMKDTRYKQITIRMLLNHSSGLYGTALGNYGGYRFNDVKKQFFKNLRNQNLNYDPGSKKVYCDDGYFLAQILIEKLSKQNFINYLRNNVLEFLNLTNTNVSLGEQAIGKSENVAYSLRSYEVAHKFESISAYGVAGLSSSSSDICNFGNNLINNKKFISKNSKNQLFEGKVAEDFNLTCDLFQFYLGWDFVFSINGKMVFLKRGSTYNYMSFFVVIPEEQISFSLLIADSSVRVPINELLATLFGYDDLSDNLIAPLINTCDIAGIYAGCNNICHFDWDNHKKELSIYLVAPIKVLLKKFIQLPNSNVFQDVDNFNTCLFYGFVSSTEGIYFYKYDKIFKSHKILYEKINTKYMIDNNKVNTSLWFRTNGYLYELKYYSRYDHMTKKHILCLKTIIDSDIVVFDGVKKLKNKYLAEPVGNFNRHGVLNLEYKNSGGFSNLKLDDRVYISESSIDVAQNGNNVIGIEMLNKIKWLKIIKSCKIKISVPKDGRFFIFSKDLELIFDSMPKSIDNTYEFMCDSEQFLEFIGESGVIFNVNVKYD